MREKFFDIQKNLISFHSKDREAKVEVESTLFTLEPSIIEDLSLESLENLPSTVFIRLLNIRWRQLTFPKTEKLLGAVDLENWVHLDPFLVKCYRNNHFNPVSSVESKLFMHAFERVRAIEKINARANDYRSRISLATIRQAKKLEHDLLKVFIKRRNLKGPRVQGCIGIRPMLYLEALCMQDLAVLKKLNDLEYLEKAFLREFKKEVCCVFVLWFWTKIKLNIIMLIQPVKQYKNPLPL